MFLSGPSPRTTGQDDSSTWRYAALRHLAAKGYDGIVFVPIPQDKFLHEGPAASAPWSYDAQIEWEVSARRQCDIEVYWIDRRMPSVPGLTTNFELGESLPAGKIIYGRPSDADHVRYLDHRYLSDLNTRRLTAQPLETLAATLDAALAYLDSYPLSIREGHDAEIPLHVWHHRPFREWLRSQQAVGNQVRIVVKNSFFIGNALFSMSFQAFVWVAHKSRWKTNEHVSTRADLSAVVVYARHPDLQTQHLLMVSEYRSPVRNELCRVLELPSGSSFNPQKTPLAIALSEVQEETGLVLQPEQLTYHGFYQAANTVSAHGHHLYSVEVPYSALSGLIGRQHGQAAESEIVLTHLIPLADILSHPAIDSTQIGLILRALGPTAFSA